MVSALAFFAVVGAPAVQAVLVLSLAAYTLISVILPLPVVAFLAFRATLSVVRASLTPRIHLVARLTLVAELVKHHIFSTINAPHKFSKAI